MTFPAYRCLLASLGKDSSLFSCAAIRNRKAVGLLLGHFKDDEAELLSVYVNPFERKKGIAAKLLGQFEKKAREKNISLLKSSFSSSMPGCEAIRKTFAGNGWADPIPHMQLITFSRDKLLQGLENNPRYAKYKNPLMPDSFQLIKWHEVPRDKLEELRKMHNAPGGWTDVDTPFREPDKLEKLNSFAIMKNNSIVGWLINHRINPETIRYNQIYNAPVARGMRGVIVQAIIHAFWLHALHGPEKGCFIIYDWNTPQQKIFDKLMRRTVDSCTESYRIEKVL